MKKIINTPTPVVVFVIYCFVLPNVANKDLQNAILR